MLCTAHAWDTLGSEYAQKKPDSLLNNKFADYPAESMKY